MISLDQPSWCFGYKSTSKSVSSPGLSRRVRDQFKDTIQAAAYMIKHQTRKFEGEINKLIIFYEMNGTEQYIVIFESLGTFEGHQHSEINLQMKA